MRRFETSLIRLAIEILQGAAARATNGPAGTIEVRLALRTLMLFTDRRDLLEALWSELTTGSGRPWCHAKLRLRHVVEMLEESGWRVSVEKTDDPEDRR